MLIDASPGVEPNFAWSWSRRIVRDADEQVLHGFDTVESANAYPASSLVNDADAEIGALGPLLRAEPEIRIYATV